MTASWELEDAATETTATGIVTIAKNEWNYREGFYLVQSTADRTGASLLHLYMGKAPTPGSQHPKSCTTELDMEAEPPVVDESPGSVTSGTFNRH